MTPDEERKWDVAAVEAGTMSTREYVKKWKAVDEAEANLKKALTQIRNRLQEINNILSSRTNHTIN